jgi:hypothetical protein
MHTIESYDSGDCVAGKVEKFDLQRIGGNKCIGTVAL